MARVMVEICLISARGLRRSSSLWKLQWFVVGWVDPNNKYCSKIDNSGSSNPTWKTKFSVTIDDTELSPSEINGLSLTVEVHSRDSIFLREKLEGTVTIPLKEFLLKFSNDPEAWRSGVEEVGSFQLRKNKSGKPQGFVDVSIRISEKKSEGVAPDTGINLRPKVSNRRRKDGMSLAMEDGPIIAYPEPEESTIASPPASSQWHQLQPPVGSGTSATYPYEQSNASSRYGQSPTAYAPNYHHQQQQQYDHRSELENGQHGRRSSTPPPPPPPSNTGFIPNFFPVGGGQSVPGSAAGGFGVGVGTGALAAGAVIFGDDFMSGNSGLPAGLGEGSLDLSPRF